MTDQLTLADAAWDAYTEELAGRLMRNDCVGFVFVAPFKGDAGEGLRIHVRPGGCRLVGPRTDYGFNIGSAQLRSDRITQIGFDRLDVAVTVVEIARNHWMLDHPVEIADVGEEFLPGEVASGSRLGPDTLRARVRDDPAQFVGGGPTIGPDLIIRIPGADFPTSVAVSMEKPQLDIFARVITDLPFDVSTETLTRVLGPKFDYVTLAISDGDLHAATFAPCDGYNFLYFCWYLSRWFEFLDEGLPLLRNALGIGDEPDGTPTGGRVARPSVDLMAAEAWETYVGELAAEIEALEPGQRLTVAQSWEYPEGPHRVVRVSLSPSGRYAAIIAPKTELLVEAGWTRTNSGMLCMVSDAEELARHVVDDALLATWDCVHPSFLADPTISEQKP